jgi:hypothetical protein
VGALIDEEESGFKRCDNVIIHVKNNIGSKQNNIGSEQRNAPQGKNWSSAEEGGTAL